jgi:hypothetical protein
VKVFGSDQGSNQAFVLYSAMDRLIFILFVLNFNEKNNDDRALESGTLCWRKKQSSPCGFGCHELVLLCTGSSCQD